MRLHTNFIASPIRWLPLLLTGLAVLVLVLAAVAAGSMAYTWRLMQTLPELEARHAQLQARRREIDEPADLPDRAALAALRDEVAVMRGLMGARGWPLGTLLARLETLLPAEVSLSALHVDAREGAVTLVAESGSVEALTGFLLQLEREPHFAHVLLVRQSRLGRVGEGRVQFEIQVQERLP